MHLLSSHSHKVNPLITVADLRTQTVKDLCALARKMGLTGIHQMKKDQLVRALVKAHKAQAASRQATGHRKVVTGKRPRSNGGVTVAASAECAPAARVGTRASRPESAPRSTNTRVLRKIQRINEIRDQRKDLSYTATVGCGSDPAEDDRAKPARAPASGKDRLVLLVRDPYWLQACWDVTRQSVLRARAALAEHWHTCEPILRLLQVDAGTTTSTAESVVRDIPVHGGVKNWYVDVQDSPNSYRVDLGYRGETGRFYTLVRSNVVTTPRPGSSDAIDQNWADIAENYEKIYALSGGYEETAAGGDLQELFEERLRRPMGSHIVTRGGCAGAQVLPRECDFDFTVDAEMIIYGKTKAGSHVTLDGEPVKLRSDGTFTVRMSMPDRRQLLPVVAASRDGAEQRTIVLAVERNTKVMEPMIREAHST